MVIDQRTVDVGERQPSEAADGVVGLDIAPGDPTDQLTQRSLVHVGMLRPAFPMESQARSDAQRGRERVRWKVEVGRTLRAMVQRVGFFGPVGTFTQQALRTQPDLAASEQVPFRTVPDILDAVEDGTVDVGFVPIEN